MKSAIAVITYNRLGALQEMLNGLELHCQKHPIAIFEDCGRDGTRDFLSHYTVGKERPELMAIQHSFTQGTEAFLATQNLGVAGNSNRALKWFMDETDADHLCLCNDDLHVLGDFPAFYSQAHRDLGVGCFCFNDFWESPTHRWIIARSRGYRLRVFPRMTGIMMSVTRHTVNKVGYFDTRFGRFGEEHCDWTNRIRMAKEMTLDGIDQMCLDVEPTLPTGEPAPPVLRHQVVETSLQGVERLREDAIAAQKIREAALRYAVEHYYRPFSLVWSSHVGGVGQRGIKSEEIPFYKPVARS